MTYRYHVEIAPGCHGKPFPPVVSRHKTFDAAKAKALRNDRLVAVDTETGEKFQISRQDHPAFGAGRFGNGARV